MPTPTAAAFRLSSAAASASSRRTIELTRSLTSFVACPRPRPSPARMGMAPPVDDLGRDDAERERDADDDERTRAAGAALLLRRVHERRMLPDLRAGRCDRPLAGPLVRRCLAFESLLDQGRLQLTEKYRVVGKLVGDLRLHAALASEALRRCLCLVGERVERAHRFAGGSSPVARRQIEVAARREASVAAAPTPA